MSGPRYAVYWVPAREHPLWLAGCRWLGRDPESTVAGTPPPYAHAPWRYGFHATLKAPLRLREGCTEAGLLQTVRELAASHPPFAMPALQLDWLAGFLALRPREPLAAAHPLRRLADDCVSVLEPWRAPMPAPELERRALGLDAAQRALLQHWGYPHVFEHWRFHLTLSDAAPQQPAALWQSAFEAFSQALSTPLLASEVSVFIEPAPSEPLLMLARFKLGG